MRALILFEIFEISKCQNICHLPLNRVFEDIILTLLNSQCSTTIHYRSNNVLVTPSLREEHLSSPVSVEITQSKHRNLIQNSSDYENISATQFDVELISHCYDKWWSIMVNVTLHKLR